MVPLRASGSERPRWLPILAALTVLAAATACGGDGGGGSAAPAKFSEIYAMAFPTSTNARCDFCHSMPPNDVGNGKLHMGADQATAYTALVGQVSVSKNCMGKPLVVPGQPDQSLLLMKLSPSPPCGNRMPLGGTPFTDAQLAMVRSWIVNGAPND